jgi:hypothetical protein
MKFQINRKTQFFLLLMISSLYFSCESFVDAGLPESQLSGEVVFEDVATARAALNNCYAMICNTTMVTGDMQGISILLGNYADEFIPYGAGQPEEAFFQNNIQPANTTISALWNNSYTLIYAINSIIEGVGSSSGISGTDKDNLIGEALVLRSLINFHLTNLFGEVPYVVSTDYSINSRIGKTAVQEMYENLRQDLTQAYNLLPADYTNTLRTTPNKSVAAALLARLYLYQGNYALSDEKANEVIANTGLYTIEEELSNVFLRECHSTLWQMGPTSEGLPTLEGQNFIFTMGPPPNRSLNPDLVNAFEPGDQRRAQWVGSVSDGTDVWYFPYKYKQNLATEFSSEYSILLRLEEMYFIRAEARVGLGNLAGGVEDINIIRQRAGLAPLSLETPEDILDAIVQERRIEFFSEQGHRWFDLKRTGRASQMLSPSKPGWNPTDILWPLPQNELLLNPNLLPQNAGY